MLIHRITVSLFAFTLFLIHTITVAQSNTNTNNSNSKNNRLTKLTLGNVSFNAELAITPEEHEIGLMKRTSLPSNQGMLFVFDTIAYPCFWMKNTHIPLSIGFFNDKGLLIKTEDMQPLDETNYHCSEKPAKYALEMNQGWFKRNQVDSINLRLRGLPDLKKQTLFNTNTNKQNNLIKN